MRFLALIVSAVLAAQAGLAQTGDPIIANLRSQFEKKVTEFTLANGLHFILIERHDAPVISFHTHVNVGASDDPGGKTGLAHMFEHMAFKGTPAIGTKNWPLEKIALDQIEVAYDRLEAERNKGPKADQKKMEALSQQLVAAIAKADQYVEPNEYDRAVESSGGADMNAGTGEDSTNYYYSFPSNRMELWFLLESERFLNPVFREFYKERDVVREERRMRVESSVQGKLIEALLATAFAAHPYRNSPAGWASDIEGFRRPDAESFYKRYYVPANMTIGIAGDVDPAAARRLADKYFARLPRRPLPDRTITEEPVQEGEKRVTVSSPAQPLLALGYKRPDRFSPDDAALSVLDAILSDGRTGLIYKDMVRDKQISLGAGSASEYPSGKYPSLFLFYVLPASGHSIDENEKAIYDIVERVKSAQVDQQSIDRVKTKLRADLIRKLTGNMGLAVELCDYYSAYGDWRRLFTELEDFQKVTATDVQRVARQYLVPEHRTVGYTFAPPATVVGGEGAK